MGKPDSNTMAYSTTQCFTATKNGNDSTIDQHGLLLEIDANLGIARDSSAID